MPTLNYGLDGYDVTKMSELERKAFSDAHMLKTLSQKTFWDRFATINTPLVQKKGRKVDFIRSIPMVELLYWDNINKQFVNGFGEEKNSIDLVLNIPRREWENFVLEERSSGQERGDLKDYTIQADVVPVGSWRSYSEEVDLFHSNWSLSREIQEQTDVAKFVIDGFYRDTYSLSATNYIDISTNNGNDAFVSSDEFTRSINKAVLSMEMQGAEPTNIVISASPKYGTIPVRSFFKMIVPTAAMEEIRNNPSFVSIEEAGVGSYGDQDFNMRTEGFLGRVEIISNPTAYYETDGTDYVGEFMIFGKDHTAQIPIRGKKRIEFIYKRLGENGDDKLNRVGSVGWKAWLGAKTVYPERLAVLKAKFNV